ncbi:mRNA cleavage and polyadenylation specificity factor complex subunit [Saitoella complicata NRRL Y-17804]|uniref:Polynucleotide 5'-hydroxyl-kinase GRC3 n=1 Tax=Saitoella complicata (strain BCRC 22490 / CBS 7301 / JCM 7358 / NBRC 10748 / NRRL Y-17804) TaxID=698492 RepID=A0A0E9NRA8_SAICN|nr:mRNA cleavage and polyadenylation specificity factor complex subunit [Saitoella complicata NRRL Y-17804]ODQ53431.1 mRNA cleavage and polyadenylation specificity factor complex subunit [Saitoella complicata NRRL Y-17804]GAO52384.1 hypothetical protein G7K_6462-t1 [Saitoella complicata NRRL Y-17804]
MSLPGLAGYGSFQAATEEQSYTLKPSQEYRFEASQNAPVNVTLLSGSAEIFGTELTIGPTYTFTSTKAAVFTWQGCEITVKGPAGAGYLAEETPMATYVNAHFGLEKQRGLSKERGEQGPRVMIVGPENAGKTSLVKLLTSYAVRQGRKPVVVGLDTKESILSIPGAMTAAQFTSILDVTSGWGTSPTSGPGHIPAKVPLTYYYGYDNIEENPKMYKTVLSRLALAISSKMADDEAARTSGCIIDTAGLISQSTGYEIIAHAITEFSVSVLVVLGSERLYSDMVRRFDGRRGLSVVRMPKSGGVVDKDESFISACKARAVREYFYGNSGQVLSPFSSVVGFDNIHVYRVASSDASISASVLPIGHEAGDTKVQVLRVEPSLILQNSVLAVSVVDSDEDASAIVESAVLGFVFVSDVDMVTKKITVLSPVAGRLPAKAFVMGSLKWMDA